MRRKRILFSNARGARVPPFALDLAFQNAIDQKSMIRSSSQKSKGTASPTDLSAYTALMYHLQSDLLVDLSQFSCTVSSTSIPLPISKLEYFLPSSDASSLVI